MSFRNGDNNTDPREETFTMQNTESFLSLHSNLIGSPKFMLKSIRSKILSDSSKESMPKIIQNEVPVKILTNESNGRVKKHGLAK